MVELRCKNFWCKSIFNIDDELLNNHNSICDKCNSLNNECSGGVESNDRQYEGDRNDKTPHQSKMIIRNWK